MMTKPKKPKEQERSATPHLSLSITQCWLISLAEKSFLQAKVAAKQSSLVLLDVGRIQGIYIQGP